MPMYPFACECGHTEDRLVAMDKRDTVRPKCPDCGKRLKRQMTTASLHEVFQMKAVMHDGSRVAGRWGREDKRLRKK